MKNSEMIGNKFNRWTVIEAGDKQNKNGDYLCLAQCECGTERFVIASSLRSGKSKSCGCIAIEKNTLRNYTHKKSKHPLYSRWNAIRKRCYVTTDSRYKYYGAKGVYMCEEWKSDPQAFYDWYESQGGDLTLTVDRIDTYGPYSPQNCRLTTMTEQLKNLRPRKDRLSDEQVLTIRQLTSEGLGPKAISEKTGVTIPVINSIRANKNYKTVK